MTIKSHIATNFIEGEVILLIDQRNRCRLITIPPSKNSSIHVFGEFFKSENFTTLAEGDILISPMRKRYLVFRPTLQEIIMYMPRQAQVIYPKDLALMLMWGDVIPGQRILEVGCGHGAMTMALLRIIGPQGLLVSYDLRHDHLIRTRKNVLLYLGEAVLSRWVPMLGTPVTEGNFIEINLDRLFTDIPEPWSMIEIAASGLRPGAIWVAFVPTVTQMSKQIKALNLHPYWSLTHGFETFQRFWHVHNLVVRPHHRMVGHTGFIVVTRRRYK